SGPDTAIVLHGGPGLHMRYLLEPLASVANHHTLVFYDLRGRGESGDVKDSTEISLEQDIADVLRVQEPFKLGKLKLVGHHWGGAVAAMFAVAHPERVDRILLVSPYPVHRSFLYQLAFVRGDSLLWAEGLQHVGTARTPAEAVEFCRKYWPMYFSPIPPHVKTPYAQLSSSLCDVKGERLLEFERTSRWATHGFGVTPWREALNRTHVPALVIEGRGDNVVTSAAVRWAQHLPEAEVLMLKEPYLVPWIGDPKRFALSVDRFLAGHIPAGSIKPPPFDAFTAAVQ